jgi:hypothetical protein
MGCYSDSSSKLQTWSWLTGVRGREPRGLPARVWSATASPALAWRRESHALTTSPTSDLALVLSERRAITIVVVRSDELMCARHHNPAYQTTSITLPWTPLSPHPLRVASQALVRPHCHSTAMVTSLESLRTSRSPWSCLSGASYPPWSRIIVALGLV